MTFFVVFRVFIVVIFKFSRIFRILFVLYFDLDHKFFVLVLIRGVGYNLELDSSICERCRGSVLGSSDLVSREKIPLLLFPRDLCC